MGYDFTKAGIDNAEFRCKSNKFYYVSEVDEYLTGLSEAAERQAAELDRLRAVEDEYRRRRQEIADVLLSVQKMAQEQAQRDKAKYAAEIAQLKAQKEKVYSELSMLQQQKSTALHEWRKSLADMLVKIDNSLKQQ